MAALTQESEHNLLPPADLVVEIDRLQECLRVERDGSKLAVEGKRGIILPLLDIIGDMEKALQWASDEEQPLVQGMRIIHEKPLALLEAHGVLPFESVGTPFNHDRHEAVAMAEHEDLEPGTVADELRRGYLWNNELLRPAQVRVAG